MCCDNFELPKEETVKKACEQFDGDSETKIAEAALADLFKTYPRNTNEAHVLLKVVALNDLYSTRIPLRSPVRPNVFDLAKRIPELNLDEAFQAGSFEIVNTISAVQFPPKRRVNRFAFATKYASWHRRDVYPIWDSNVQNYLTCLRRLHPTDWDIFSDGFGLSGNWGYPGFHALIVRFRSYFKLENVSFRDLDKFLWLRGSPEARNGDLAH